MQKGIENTLCGFVTSVLSCGQSPEALRHKGGSDSITNKNERLFLISNSESPREIIENPSKSKSSKNRKWISHSEAFQHKKRSYRVNVGKSGIYTGIMHKMIEQLEICETKWGRVFVLFFNLHHSTYKMDTNKHISRFRKNLSQRIGRTYELHEMGYVWVREQERAKSQHYHFAIFLDGDRIRHSSKMLEIVKDTWKAINPDNHIPVIKNPFYFIDNEETKADAIYRLSYLAKSRGKGYRDKQVKDYSTSRMRMQRIKHQH